MVRLDGVCMNAIAYNSILLWLLNIVVSHYRDEFSESQSTSAPSASGMNPYSSYYGATEYAAQDAYNDEQQQQSRQGWNEESNQY